VSLSLILDKMLRVAENGDWEAAHMDADRLLVDTVRELAPKNDTVAEILEAYSAVGKWYA